MNTNKNGKAFMDNDDFCIILKNASEELKSKLIKQLNLELIGNLEAEAIKSVNPTADQDEIEEILDFLQLNLNNLSVKTSNMFRMLSKKLEKNNLYLDNNLNDKIRRVSYHYLLSYFENQNGKEFLSYVKQMESGVDNFFLVFGKFTPKNLKNKYNLLDVDNPTLDLALDEKEKLLIDFVDFYAKLTSSVQE